MSTPDPAPPPTQSLPHRLALPALCILLTAALLGGLLFSGGRAALLRQHQVWMEELGAHVRHQIATTLRQAQELNAQHAAAIESGALDPNQGERLAGYLLRLVRTRPELSLVAVASAAPHYVDAARLEDPEHLKLALWDPERGGTRDWKTRRDGTRVELLKDLPHYDPRQRPWYQKAEAAGRPAWSAVYASLSPQRLLVSHVHPVHEQGGALRAVLSTSISLSRLSDFLSNLRADAPGQVFVMDREGWLIAASGGERPFRIGPKGPERIRADTSASSLTRAAARQLSALPGGLAKLSNGLRPGFSHEGAAQQLLVQSYSDADGLDWLVVIVMPESQAVAELAQQARWALTLGVLGLLGALAAFGWWRRPAQP